MRSSPVVLLILELLVSCEITKSVPLPIFKFCESFILTPPVNVAPAKGALAVICVCAFEAKVFINCYSEFVTEPSAT